MRQRNVQQGSAETAAITALVIVLIVALGWVIYQNFIYKEPAEKIAATRSSDTEKNVDQTEQHNADLPEGWLGKHNEESGFMFGVPSEWKNEVKVEKVEGLYDLSSYTGSFVGIRYAADTESFETVTYDPLDATDTEVAETNLVSETSTLVDGKYPTGMFRAGEGVGSKGSFTYFIVTHIIDTTYVFEVQQASYSSINDDDELVFDTPYSFADIETAIPVFIKTIKKH